MGSTSGDLTWLVLVAFVFAWFAGLGVGWILANVRFEKLLTGFLADARAERKEASVERDSLLTRIQGWSPEPKETLAPAAMIPPRPQGSQPAETVEIDALSLAELAEKGIVPDGDGFFDEYSKCLFDSVEDVEIWRAMLREKKLPVTLSPALAGEMGFADALGLARKLAEKRKKERIAEESGDLEEQVAEG